MTTLTDIGENELIRLIIKDLKKDVSVILGPGDDCAVVKGSRENLLLKTDTVVEGVHFTPETPAKLIGRKAMARVISDFAAMAATPRHALVTLIAPPQTPVKRVLEVYAGLRAMADSYGVNIVGGETSSGSQLIITVSLTGTAPAKKWISRSAASVGDQLYVTGRLGGSIRGKHLKFEPRMKEAHWIAQNLPVRAMMDLSDGLSKDLPRMAAACGLGFELDAKAIPKNPGCTLAQALGDGEDYELLLALAPSVTQAQLADWKTAFPKLKLTCIGTLVEGMKTGHAIGGGWEHF
ncbi:thiamine-phosphate kinase [Prosthecobacter sp. SYSU 5D2]|uniref:thiamine-phosphate kinase n=1 Tax=Prosthecobacter sp. SYSU 5D2 TaxID=3134134 RepID=UPI0031FE5A79